MGVVLLVKIVISSVMSLVSGESKILIFSFGKDSLPNVVRTKLDYLGFVVHKVRIRCVSYYMRFIS